MTSGAGNWVHRIPDVIDHLPVLLPDHFGAHDTSSPVLHSGASEGDANKCHGDRTNDGWEDHLNNPTWDDGEHNLQQRAQCTGAEHLAIGNGPINSVSLHLLDGYLKDGKEREGCAHDAEQATADVELPTEQFLSQGDRNFQDVDYGADTAGDQGGDNGILLEFDIHKVDSEAEDDVGWSDETSDHGEGVL